MPKSQTTPAKRPKPETLPAESDAPVRPQHTEAPSVSDVRLALAHFAELCAAFEGHGLGFDYGSATEPALRHFHCEHLAGKDDDIARDRKVFTDVVTKLLRHRELQRQDQRRLVLVHLSDALATRYAEWRDHSDLDRDWLLKRVEAVFGHADLHASHGDIEECTPNTRKELSAGGGPVEFAKSVLPDVISNTSCSGIGKFRSARDPLNAARRSFGRWVPIGILGRYLATAIPQILRNQVDGAQATVPTLDDIARWHETTALRVDRRLEGILRAAATDWGTFVGIHPQDVQQQIDVEVEQRRLKLRIIANHAIDKAPVDGSWLRRLPARLLAPAREAATSMGRSTEMEDAASAALESAILEEARADVLAQYGPQLLAMIGENPRDNRPPAGNPWSSFP